MDVHVRNEEDLMEFARALDMLNESMVGSFNMAHQEMNRVLEGWNDDQARHFMDGFVQATQTIQQIGVMMTDFSGYIKRYAEGVSNLKSLR